MSSRLALNTYFRCAGDVEFEGTHDQVLAALAKNLERHVLRDALLLDQPPAEIELDLGGGRKAHLDLLEADADQQLEHLELFLDAHRLGEGLVAIAKVDAAPLGRLGQDPIGPLPLRQGDDRERTILGDGSGLHGRERDEG
jgi:hypothetical protein